MIILVTGSATEELKELAESLKGRGHEIVVCDTADEAHRAVSATSGSDHVAKVVAFPGGGQVSKASHSNGSPEGLLSTGRGLTDIVEELESRLVAAAMTRTGNNQVRAAELLKITRGALQYKLKKYVRDQAA
jgi:transcriptional regulator with PAS, ATPase and Fis domain